MGREPRLALTGEPSYSAVRLSLIPKASYDLTMFVLFIIVVWLIVTILVPLLEMKAKGQTDGVHVSYFLMVTPLMCGAHWAFETIHSRLEYYVVGGLIIGFLAQAVVSCVKDLHKIFRKAKLPRFSPHFVFGYPKAAVDHRRFRVDMRYCRRPAEQVRRLPQSGQWINGTSPRTVLQSRSKDATSQRPPACDER